MIAVLFLPLLAIAALAIKLVDGGPVFYKQRRLGEHGDAFDILKLRTMRVDAERDGPQWSPARDERITRIGRLLRRSHLDEVPQLLNIFRGEMTLVGPRPERPEIVAELERRFPHYTRRQLVKPGIAGWAALRCGYAGSDLGTAWKLCHDLFYIKRRSVLSDTLILAETSVEVFRDAHRGPARPGRAFPHRRGSRLTVPQPVKVTARALSGPPGRARDPGQALHLLVERIELERDQDLVAGEARIALRL